MLKNQLKFLTVSLNSIQLTEYILTVIVVDYWLIDADVDDANESNSAISDAILSYSES